MDNKERLKPAEEWKLLAHEAALETRGYLLQYKDSELGSEQSEFAKKRAHQSFEQFVMLTRPWLRRVISPRVFYNEEDVMDIEQNVYERVYKGLVKFRGDAQVTSWLYTIALKRLSDYYKSKAKRLDHEVTLEDPSVNYASLYGNPEQEYENTERSDMVISILSQVKEPHRKAVIYMHGFDYMQGEVGEILEKTPNNVRQMVFRGLKAAREVIGHKKDSDEMPES